MKSSFLSSVLFLIGMLLLVSPAVEAFAPTSSKLVTTNNNNLQQQSLDQFHSRTNVALEAYKKKEPVTAPKEEKEKTPPLKLFLAYATPWRNPNSIFVYLFLAVYLLGSYSEAKSAAGM